MNKFIAAMDNSGGSAGGVLDLYKQVWNEENKMDLINEFRLRMIKAPAFNSDNIWAAIVYKENVDKGICNPIHEKGIETYLKIDNGINSPGTLKHIDLDKMLEYAKEHKCTGTKMRSVISSNRYNVSQIVDQQFEIAQKIADAGLTPIIEPEVDINHVNKLSVEKLLLDKLQKCLKTFNKCILKLTIPDSPGLYDKLDCKKIVALSGGYSLDEACQRLKLQKNMSASFSRALSEGLTHNQTDEEFNSKIASNISKIVEAS